jgi:hypothetical protein
MAEEKPAMEGYLLKWTNYMKGFQRRYFVLDRGILSYYKFGLAGDVPRADLLCTVCQARSIDTIYIDQ